LDWCASWADKNLRLKRQDESILANKHHCYNNANTPQKRWICPIKVKGKIYPCIRAAIRQAKIPRTTLIRYLDHPTDLYFVYLIE
jgi:hypothetical protein